MQTLSDWINPQYLNSLYFEQLQETVKSKPNTKYLVLDNFFNDNKLKELIEQHKTLEFSEYLDRRTLNDEKILPYDGSVVFANPKIHVGSDLFFNPEWHQYLVKLVNSNYELNHPCHTEIKLRYHRPYANGFWIHTDSIVRKLVIICYFNKNWKYEDGGMLQLWRVDEECSESSFKINNIDPELRMDFLANHKRIQTNSPGGGFLDNQIHDLVLLDQILPIYNRVFICDLGSDVYHSVTPSNGKERTGFVQWLM
jgi:hypothetical protein